MLSMLSAYTVGNCTTYNAEFHIFFMRDWASCLGANWASNCSHCTITPVLSWWSFLICAADVCVWLVAGLRPNISNHWNKSGFIFRIQDTSGLRWRKPMIKPSRYGHNEPESRNISWLRRTCPHPGHRPAFSSTGRVQAHGLTRSRPTLATKTHRESAWASGSTACVTSWENYQGAKHEA